MVVERTCSIVVPKNQRRPATIVSCFSQMGAKEIQSDTVASKFGQHRERSCQDRVTISSYARTSNQLASSCGTVEGCLTNIQVSEVRNILLKERDNGFPFFLPSWVYRNAYHGNY